MRQHSWDEIKVGDIVETEFFRDNYYKIEQCYAKGKVLKDLGFHSFKVKLLQSCWWHGNKVMKKGDWIPCDEWELEKVD